MGLNQSAGQARTYVNMTSEKTLVDGKEVYTPRFRVGNKGDYKRYPNIEGQFRSITFTDKEFENSMGKVIKYRSFELILDDKDGTAFHITGKADSGLGRDVLNKLSSVDELGRVSISLYNNKSGFQTSRCMNDGVDLNWKLTREEQEPLITKKEVDVDGEKTVIKSYKKLNEAIEKNMSGVHAKQSFVDNLLNEVTEPTETTADSSILPF